MSELGGIHVLHVDDDPELAELVADMLEREDDRFTVETATSASDGFERLSDTAYDCVVSDYDMPGQNGIEFLETIREDYPDLPFLLYTGKGSEEVASDAISAGVTDYLQKGGGTEQYQLLANRVCNAVEQYRSTQEAKQTRRRLQNLAESTSHCVWMFDRDWEELLFVSGYEAVWSRPTQAIRDNPQDFLNGVHPEAREVVRDAMERMSNGESIDVEYRILRGDGETGWVWVQGEPVFDDDGTVKSVVGFTRDITDRKEREQELRRNKRAIDEAPVGVTITDPDREDNPIIYANRTFLELTGYCETEVLGRNCRFLQGEATDPDQVATMREAIDSEQRVTVELRNYRRDGTEFWNRVSIAPVHDDDGSLVNYVGFQQDVTERKEQEQQPEET